MNKLISKIVGVGLGLALATGVGAGVVLGNKNIAKTDAASDTTTYQLVNSASDLEAGKSYLITNGTSGTVKTIATTSNNNNRPTTNISVTNGKITRGSSAMSFTLGGSSGAWTFATENYAGTAGYLNATNTTSSNYLKVVADLDNYAYFTIAFDSDAAVITCTGKSSRNLMRCNTSGTPIACYTSGQNPVYLFKEAGAATSFSVSYDANGGTGTAPTDNTAYSSGQTVTVLAATGLSKDGYTFSGWNTAANGSGTSYSAGDTFTISANTILYAQWDYNTHYTDDATAKTITWNTTLPEQISASADTVVWDSPKVTLTAEKNTGSTAVNNYLPPAQSTTRMYVGNKLTFSAKSGSQVSKIIFNANTAGYSEALAGSTWTNATASYSETIVTVVATDSSSDVSVVLTAQTGFGSIVVYYGAPAALSSISVSGSMTNTTYKVGDNWNPAGLVVTATYSDSSTANVTSAVTWSFDPATANATTVTSVTATASYTEGGVTKTANSAAQTVTVTEKQGSTDVITIDNTVTSGTAYSTTTGIAGDTAIYTSHNAHASETNGNGLQYRTNDNTSGIVSTTSGGLIKSVTITYAEGKSGQMDVYGKNTAYAGPADLYNDATKGTLLGSVSSTGTVEVTGDYEYVGVRSSNGARYLTSIEFVWGVEDTSAPKITIDQTSSEQVAGDTGTLTATTENAGTNTVAWTSSDSTVVSINETTGAWQAKKIGAATITATLGSTGKFSTITITVTGNVSVAEARTLIDALASGATSEYKVTVSGYVISFNGDGTKSKNNSITIADTADGTDTFQIFFGYNAVSNWAEAAVAGAKISAKGNLTKYNTTYEMTSPTNVQVISADKAAVQDFVRDYMHMNDYDPSLDNSQGTGACNGVSGYYMAAKGALTGLTETQISLFQSDSEFDAAQARYEAWANAYGDNTPYATTVGSARMLNNFNGSNAAIIVLITAFVGITFVAGYFLLRKKKEN